MDREQLSQLEAAAVDIMSPPHCVSEAARKKAESFFLELRKSKLPYNACKFILEESSSAFVLFQAASTMQEAVLREWVVLPGEEKEALRAYILHYLTSRPSLASYVQRQLLTTVALMVKRATLEVDRKKLFDSVFSTVSQLLAMSDIQMRFLGCSLLGSLLVEYSSSTGSSSIGLPLEFHSQCKSAIESEELLRVLLYAVHVLQQYVVQDWSTLSPQDVSLLSSFLELTSQVLNWDFQQKFRAITTTEHISVVLRPPKSYAATFLDPSFLFLFFQLFQKVRCNETQLHHVVQCLTQLASLTKPVFSTDQEQQTYVSNFVAGVLEYMSSSSDPTCHEVYGLSCIFRRLMATFSIRHFASIDLARVELLVQLLAQLTCHCARRAVQSSSSGESNEDALTYHESLEHFLEVWVSLLEDSASLPSSLVTQPSIEVFNSFVQSKLSAPRGWRTMDGRQDDEEIVEIDEDDRVTFQDSLSSVGFIARTIACHSLPLLRSLLEQCISECLQFLSLLQLHPQALTSGQNNLDSLYEDLHWLTLIAGYTLCDIARGEEVLIPTQLMQCSIEQWADRATTVPDVSRDATIAALVWKDVESLASQSGSELILEKMDPIASLVLSVFRLSSLEKLFVNHGLMDILSPQLCDTVAWCLSHIAEPYIMINEESYVQLSLSLLPVFGCDSESSHWLTSFLVEKVAFNLSVWTGEESLSLTTVGLLKAVMLSPRRAAVASRCDVLWTLMRKFSSGEEPFSFLPPAVQQDLMGSLVMCGMVGEGRTQFLTELLQPLSSRFTSLVRHPSFPAHCQDGPTQQSLLSILEALCGLALYTRAESVEHFFSFLLPLLQTCVELSLLYSDVAEVTGVILRLFGTVAANYVVFLDEAQTSKLYEVSLTLIRAYAKCNTGKYTRLALAEEEQCEDLVLFMKLLYNLTAKDYIDFSSSESSSSSSGGGGGGPEAPVVQRVQPVDVVVTGISIILPLMTEELLKFPSLCQQFFSLICYVCELFPEKVVQLPDTMLLTYLKLLEAGMTNYGSDFGRRCLESVDSIASHCGSAPHLHSSSEPLTHSLQHFLKIIFELMVSIGFDMDLIGPASGAIFALICAQKEYYSHLVSSLVGQQNSSSSSGGDTQSQARLMEAFNQLTPPSLTFDLSRKSKAQFRRNLVDFLPFVKGLLCYR